jgi:hypothetical protein
MKTEKLHSSALISSPEILLDLLGNPRTQEYAAGAGVVVHVAVLLS